MVNPSIQFEVHPSSGVPIYRQLMDQVRAMIASGQLADGDLLPSVRQMADELQVNMMTVSKAWSRLEVEGVLEREPASGALDRRQSVEVLGVRAGKEPGAPEHLVGEELRQGRSPEPGAAPDPDAARRRGIGQHRVFGGTVADKPFLIATED